MANVLETRSLIYIIKWTVNSVDKTELSYHTPSDAASQFLKNLPLFNMWSYAEYVTRNIFKGTTQVGAEQVNFYMFCLF